MIPSNCAWRVVVSMRSSKDSSRFFTVEAVALQNLPQTLRGRERSKRGYASPLLGVGSLPTIPIGRRRPNNFFFDLPTPDRAFTVTEARAWMVSLILMRRQVGFTVGAIRVRRSTELGGSSHNLIIRCITKIRVCCIR